MYRLHRSIGCRALHAEHTAVSSHLTRPLVRASASTHCYATQQPLADQRQTSWLSSDMLGFVSSREFSTTSKPKRTSSNTKSSSDAQTKNATSNHRKNDKPRHPASPNPTFTPPSHPVPNDAEIRTLLHLAPSSQPLDLPPSAMSFWKMNPSNPSHRRAGIPMLIAAARTLRAGFDALIKDASAVEAKRAEREAVWNAQQQRKTAPGAPSTARATSAPVAPSSPLNQAATASATAATATPTPAPSRASPVSKPLIQALNRVTSNPVLKEDDQLTSGLDPAEVSNLRTKLERVVVQLIYALYETNPPLTLPPTMANNSRPGRAPLSPNDPPLQSFALSEILETCKRMDLHHCSLWLWNEYARVMIDRSEQSMNDLLKQWKEYKQSAAKAQSENTAAPIMPNYFNRHPEFFPVITKQIARNLVRTLGYVDFRSSASVYGYLERTDQFLEKYKTQVEEIHKEFPVGDQYPKYFQVAYDADLSPSASGSLNSFENRYVLCRALLQACSAVEPKPLVQVAEVILDRFLQTSSSSSSPSGTTSVADEKLIEKEVEGLYLMLLSSYARNGDHLAALSLLNKFKAPNVYVVTSVLTACSRTAEGALRGLQLFEELEHRNDDPVSAARWANFQPDLIYYELILRLYELTGNLNEALQLFEDLSAGKASLQPTAPAATNPVPSALGAPVASVPSVRPSHYTFSQMIHSCGRGIQAIQRRARLKRGEELGEPHDLLLVSDGTDMAEQLWNAAQRLERASVGDGDRANHGGAADKFDAPWDPAFDDIPMSKNPPSVFAYNIPQLMHMARSFFEIMQKEPFYLRPNETVYKNLIGVLSHGYASLATIEALWQNMIDSGIRPRAITWTAFLFALVKCGGPENLNAVLQWHTKMCTQQRRHIGADNVSVNVVLHAISRNIRIEATSSHKRAKEKQYNLVRRSLDHFGMLAEFKQAPDPENVQALMKCLALANRVEYIESVLLLLGTNKGKFDGKPAKEIEWKHKAFPDSVIRLLEAAAPPNVHMYNYLLQAHIPPLSNRLESSTIPLAAVKEANAAMKEVLNVEETTESVKAETGAESRQTQQSLRAVWDKLIAGNSFKPNVESHVLLLQGVLSYNQPRDQVAEAYDSMHQAVLKAKQESLGGDFNANMGNSNMLNVSHLVALLRVASSLPLRASAADSPLLFLWNKLEQDESNLLNQVPIKVLEHAWSILAQQCGPKDATCLRAEKMIQRLQFDLDQK